jgi:CII-binding regulator of phage lambda lysogenization HflD
MVMDTDIESLRARKEGLKAELQAEEEKEKSLQEEILTLKEMIEILDLERELEAKRESVKQLESRRNELQNRWTQQAQETEKNKEPSSQFMTDAESAHNPEPVKSDEKNAQKKQFFF